MLSQTISAEKVLQITMSGGGLAPSLSDVLDGKADAVLSHDPAANKVILTHLIPVVIVVEGLLSFSNHWETVPS
jgi:hypothetical protein